MLAAFDVANDVCALDIGQSLRRQNQFHLHRSLLHKIDNHLGVLGRDRAGRDLRRVRLVIGLASVRQTVIRAANGTNQTGDCALSCRCARAVGAIDDRAHVQSRGKLYRSESDVDQQPDDGAAQRRPKPRPATIASNTTTTAAQPRRSSPPR